MMTAGANLTIDDFITRWAASEGAERANFQLFASELCALLGVVAPRPTQGQDAELNDYCFERAVKFKEADGSTSDGRIDLYKRSAFVMEAKQSREKDRPKALVLAGQPDLFVADSSPRGERGASRAWDQLMISARRQAEEYAKALPPAHGWPPFVLVCDVGHCIEVYADFTGQGKNYRQFPDRQGYRIYLKELRDKDVRDRLKRIWEEPASLDPARQSAKVTREIAARLAAVSKGLEQRKENAEDVALFLMRCLFTMFAEDVDLLPKGCFTNWLDRAKTNADRFQFELKQLWEAMDKGGFATIAESKVKRFNGHFFASAQVLKLERDEIVELYEAAKHNWKEVDPAIFGTLLEQALDEKERSRLGAHYTPRAYVERLVLVTVLEPLRQEWAQVQATAERFKIEAEALEQEAKEAGSKAKLTAAGRSVSGAKAAEADAKLREAIGVVRTFHGKLCHTRVLDPACGTGNFLYVAMEMMKLLEGEVLEAISNLAGPQDDLTWLSSQTVDPHQFLGMELNPRAKEIAELVIWLGYLQWHFRTKGSSAPAEPILRDFGNIKHMDAVLTWDGYPVPQVIAGADGTRVEAYPNLRRPEWPEAEYIVGNPPFNGGKDLRSDFGDSYVERLWKAHSDVDESADFVMYWWDRAAIELSKKGTVLQRFGLVTTNSITQVFSRRTVAKHLTSKLPISLLMAIPDHPWRKRAKRELGQPKPPDEKLANVRIAMTVAISGNHTGVLREVISEDKLDTDNPKIEMSTRIGRINSDLTVGVDVTTAEGLRANEGMSSPGVKLHGAGFIVTPAEAKVLGLGKRPGLECHNRHYRNGRDLTGNSRSVMVIDLFGLEADEVRRKFPEIYQRVLERVKPERDTNRRTYRRVNWWLFGENNPLFRESISGLPRYIATVETAKHRTFQFLDGSILPDNMLVGVGSDDGFHLGVMSSRAHIIWTLYSGGTLENRPRYNKTRCFDPFPFPDPPAALKSRIRAVAEELDAHRKACQAEYPRLTLTQMYNVLETLKAGDDLDAVEDTIKTQGLVLILRELHDKLDALVFEAYGWSATLTDEEILERLVALNKHRALEEKVGKIKWLRPDYQIPRFGNDAERARLAAEKAKTKDDQLALLADDEDDDEATAKPKFPTGKELEETAAVMRVLASAHAPLSVKQIRKAFDARGRIDERIASTVLALARLGHLTSPDGGDSFMVRRGN